MKNCAEFRGELLRIFSTSMVFARKLTPIAVWEVWFIKLSQGTFGAQCFTRLCWQSTHSPLYDDFTTDYYVFTLFMFRCLWSSFSLYLKWKYSMNYECCKRLFTVQKGENEFEEWPNLSEEIPSWGPTLVSVTLFSRRYHCLRMWNHKSSSVLDAHSGSFERTGIFLETRGRNTADSQSSECVVRYTQGYLWRVKNTRRR